MITETVEYIVTQTEAITLERDDTNLVALRSTVARRPTDPSAPISEDDHIFNVAVDVVESFLTALFAASVINRSNVGATLRAILAVMDTIGNEYGE